MTVVNENQRQSITLGKIVDVQNGCAIFQQECDAKGLEVYNFVYERYQDSKNVTFA